MTDDELAAERAVRQLAAVGVIKLNAFGFVETHDGRNWGTAIQVARMMVREMDRFR